MTRIAGFALVLSLIGAAASGLAQENGGQSGQAQVTIYSSGSTLFGAPGSLGAFMGKVYVDGHEFARLDRHRFLILKLAPGLHNLALSVWMVGSPDPHAVLPIRLEENSQYFISTNFMGTSWTGSMALVIREVTCEAAQRDNADTKALDRKKLTPDGAAVALTWRVFPHCQ
jgi:hypothetical protein